MNNVLYEELEEEMRQEEEETIGESIAMQFYFGNWTDAVNKMEELNVSTGELCEFLEENAFDSGCTLSDDYYYGGCFTYSFFIELAEHLVRRSM